MIVFVQRNWQDLVGDRINLVTVRRRLVDQVLTSWVDNDPLKAFDELDAIFYATAPLRSWDNVPASILGHIEE
jgi:hypothetical protein